MSLHSTRNTLPEEIRRKSVDLLGQSLATAIDVQRQAKQAHWNVKGPNFIALHLLFDEVHTAAIEWADLFTEISRAVDDYLWKVEAHNHAR